jgi:hypothetical protein
VVVFLLLCLGSLLIAALTGGVWWAVLRLKEVQTAAAGPSPDTAREQPHPGGSRAAAPAASREWLVGTWKVHYPDGRYIIMQLSPDGRMVLDAYNPKSVTARTLRQVGRWEVVAEQGNEIRVRRSLDGPGAPYEQDFLFTGKDRFLIREGDHRILYERVR